MGTNGMTFAFHVPVHLMCLVKVPVLERGLQLGLDPQGARSTAARSGHHALRVWVPKSLDNSNKFLNCAPLLEFSFRVYFTKADTSHTQGRTFVL